MLSDEIRKKLERLPGDTEVARFWRAALAKVIRAERLEALSKEIMP